MHSPAPCMTLCRARSIRRREMLPSAGFCSKATATALPRAMIWRTLRARLAAIIWSTVQPIALWKPKAGRTSRWSPPVQGNAVGVGPTMLLHCDLVYLADNARLSTPFVNLALVPEAASSWLLPSRIGHARAYAMFALGEPMDAATALACGLANAVAPQSELRKKAHDAAVVLTKRPAGSLSLTKKLMRDHQRIAVQINEEGRLFKERLKTPEAREAFAAFAERRQPDFTRASA